MLPPSFAKQSVCGTIFQSVFWWFCFPKLTVGFWLPSFRRPGQKLPLQQENFVMSERKWAHHYYVICSLKIYVDFYFMRKWLFNWKMLLKCTFPSHQSVVNVYTAKLESVEIGAPLPKHFSSSHFLCRILWCSIYFCLIRPCKNMKESCI